MNIKNFGYNLPEDKIALYPPAERGTSRLLVFDRENQSIAHKMYSNLPDYLNPGDVLVLNDTKVIKARLIAHAVKNGITPTVSSRPELYPVLNTGSRDPGPVNLDPRTTGIAICTHSSTRGQIGNLRGDDRLEPNREVELLLLEIHPDQKLQPNEALALHRGHLKLNEELVIGNCKLVIAEIADEGIVRLHGDIDPYTLAETEGEVPLPPYLHRSAEPADTERYQTVFAKKPGSVAAPTASLNLTAEMLDRIRARGVKVVNLTLHVGLGTFLPIRSDNVEEHQIHSEWYSIPTATIVAINELRRTNHEQTRTGSTRATTNKVVAVGTTVARALEHAAEKITNLQLPITNGIQDEAKIFIFPRYEFKIVDALLTNFHAPRSTVLLLAATFAGKENLEKCYAEAIAHDYKFLSYGDSMLIL